MSEVVAMYQTLRDLRGISPGDECPECSGTGYKCYPSTAVFMGGIGGQAITESVCDHCWGSGRKSQPWPSWKEAINRERTDHAEIARLRAELDAAREAIRTAIKKVMKTKAGEPRQALWDLLKFFEQWSSQDPAVRAACEGKR